MAITLTKKSNILSLTRITSTKPDAVTKEFFLNPNGTLRKTTTAHVTAGTMETIRVSGLEDFSGLLQTLTVNNCLTYGVTGHDNIDLMTEKAWVQAGRPDNALPRSSKHMSWDKDGGIFMLDYDPPKDKGTQALTREELITSLKAVCPWLQDVAMLWWPSTSSCIYLGDKELSSIKGQRIYIGVNNAMDIPRLGKVVNTLLWANGIGYFEVSKSGSLLDRGLFDGSVWQPNRIDFAAGAMCHDGLEQRRGAPLLMQGKLMVLDSLATVPDPSPDVVATAEANKAKAKAEKREEAAKVRQEWVDLRVAELIKSTPDMPKEHAEATVRRAVGNQVLMGDWQIKVMYGDAVHAFSVLHILDHPNEFHGLETLDPLEPDYDGGRPVGKIFIFGARPCLYSMAHGGTPFKLVRQPVGIEIVKGKIREATDAAIEALRQAPEVFDFGTGIVTLGNSDRLQPLDSNGLSYVLSGIVQFYIRKDTPKGVVDSYANPPASLCNSILSLHEVRRLKTLVALITAPTLRPDGTVLSSQGYDVATGLLFDAVEPPPGIPDKPTKEQSIAALDRLWKPFADFPFVTPLDRAVFLAAMLTAVVRAALPTAPGFGFDAPTQSSGKTLLARCLGVLATGNEPGVFPHTAGGSDEETRKRLFAALRAGDRVILLDNILGSFDSAAMAALLTCDTYRDRVLGYSEVSSVPNRTLVLFTGNNLTFAGDMPRRVLVCRIDPQTDQPFARTFDLNPVQYCLEHRQQMVADALTLIRFSLSSGVTPLGAGRMGSFEAWDSWVRQTILYIERELCPGNFGDVMDQIIANQATDPEQESLGRLLQAWRKVFGDKWQSVSEVLDVYRNVASSYKSQLAQGEEELVEAIDDFHVSKKPLSTKVLGKMLSYRKDRIVGGMRLKQSKVGKEASHWRVEKMPIKAKKD